MSPIREYLCGACGHLFDEIVRSTNPDDYKFFECRCGSKAEMLPSRPTTSRGSFGTVPRNAKEKPQALNFSNKKDSE